MIASMSSRHPKWKCNAMQCSAVEMKCIVMLLFEHMHARHDHQRYTFINRFTYQLLRLAPTLLWCGLV